MQTKSQPVNFTPGSASALVAASIIDEAIEFMEGFRDDTTQDHVTGCPIASVERLEGGAA